MLGNKLYFAIKPLVPLYLRRAVRRRVALRKRAKVGAVWPVLPGSERPPPGWPGWPEGKKFAFVLTHDVEGPNGLAKCRQLMELEKKHGFRSSFNFIPEGDYQVTRELREELTRNGFEVGVHDLHHDGRLYGSRPDFSRKASRINQHLKAWGAVGFRSGFMLHNLEWLQDLDIQYDASTFDTDPFEPQPDGAGTIFPFWKQGVDGRGFVELPYTLPQDSTLFLLLDETTTDVWQRKLSWVAQHGGMALLDVHPDYMAFEGSGLHFDEYPCARYGEFLEFVSRKFKGQYWHATPKEVAQWYNETCRGVSRNGQHNVPKRRRLQGKKAAVLLYSYYASDARPRREAETLAQAGMEVDVICLRQNEAEASLEILNGVNVRRMPMARRREGKFTYLAQYSMFIGWCGAALALRSLRKRYDLVHVHNMPDFLVFSALGPKLRGARVILDLHDPMPELLMTIFGIEEKSFGVRLLKLLEKMSIAFADQVLTVNRACEKIFGARSCRPEKIQVVMNSPDEEIFGFKPVQSSAMRDPAKPFVIMYHGSIVKRNGLDLAVEALRLVRKTIPRAELRVYGARTPFLDLVLDSVQKTGLADAVRYFGPRSLDQIVQEIEGCDAGIIPNRKNIFTEINTPTRIFEYLSRGKVAIAPLAPGIVDYFGPQELLFFQLGDAEDLARQIEHVYHHPKEAEEITRRGQEIYLAHKWSCEKERFLDRIQALLLSPTAAVLNQAEKAEAMAAKP
jgi:glycosyltransferase involved in cell wall biosynthesis